MTLSTVAPDWAQKGAHIKASGVELSVRPDHAGEIVFQPFFSSTSPAEAKKAIAQAKVALADRKFRRQLHDAALRATKMLGKGDAKARARSAETQHLANNLERMGI